MNQTSPLRAVLFVILGFLLAPPLLADSSPAPKGFRLIPGGSYYAGDITAPHPRQLVRLEPFEILDHPVTNLEYKLFVDATRHPAPLHWKNGQIPPGKEDHPVVFVNRDDVNSYLRWLTAVDGRVYRLPTTVEFEYAARGGLEGKKYPWGDGDPALHANFDADGSRSFDGWERYLQPARWGSPNGYGLYGTAGNVWQMVDSQPDPVTIRFKYRLERPHMATGPVYGGSWARGTEYLRCGNLANISPGSRQPDVGFRPVRSPQGADWRVQHRRLVAQSLGKGKVLLSWALLASDSAETAFDVFRSVSRTHAGFRVNSEPITQSTSFLDFDLKPGQRYHYYVQPLTDPKRDKKGRRSEWCGVTVSEEAQTAIFTFQPLARQGGVVPVFGDLDGDGQMDCVIRLDNGNVEMSQDPGIPVQLEAFTSYGRSLWRVNVSNHDHCFGNHNNVPFNVWDMDGDGKAEVITRFQAEEQDWVAILDGMTGAVKKRVEWPPMISDFDRSSTRIHLSVVCLDGRNPAIVTQTGLYDNEVITAYDSALNKLWEYQSLAETNGSGGHKIEAADVDGDGKQEVFAGTMYFNPDGTLRWCIYRQHPDIVSVHDYLPDRPGLEVFYLIESSMHAGAYLVDASSGEILWKHNRESDPRWTHGHAGWTADIWSGSPGMECAVNRAGHNDRNWVLFSADGKPLIEPFPAGFTPFEWDGDSTRELLSSDGRSISEFDGTGLVPGNGDPLHILAKARLLMTADICGDFRDELVLAITTDKGQPGIAVVMATDPITKRFISRLEDREYRFWLARNMGGGYKSVFDQPLQEVGPVIQTSRDLRSNNAGTFE